MRSGRLRGCAGRSSMTRDLFDLNGEAGKPQPPRTTKAQSGALLPPNPERSLTYLDVQDFSGLLTAVMNEASKGGLPAPPVSEPSSSPRIRGSRGMTSSVGSNEGVTASKANLVRAAIKAGVKP